MDSGDMYIKGEKFAPRHVLEASEKGIGMIVQEMGTIRDLSVAANIFFGYEKNFTKGGVFLSAKMNKTAQTLLDSLGMQDINARTKISQLGAESRKLVEIARIMYKKPEVLIIDETTTALSQVGRDILYEIIKKQKAENKAVIFITHDLDELMEVCTSITVLRDGIYIDTMEKEKTSIHEIREMMVGREFSGHYYRADMDGAHSKEAALSLEHVSDDALITDLSLTLHKGEILGIAGLSECGMHELGRLAYGINPTITGKVFNHLRSVEIRDCYTAKNSGIGYVSKNRDLEAVVLNASIKDNILMPSYRLIEKHHYISSKAEKNFAKKESDLLKIKCNSLDQYVSELSGGNKQKVVFAKWMGNGSDIFIMDCPTRGIDIGVKAGMYKLMYKLKKQGKAILLISEELTELIGMSDRIVVMKDGKITGEILRDEMPTEKQIVEYMI